MMLVLWLAPVDVAKQKFVSLCRAYMPTHELADAAHQPYAVGRNT